MFNKFKNWFGDNFFWIATITFMLIYLNTCSQNNKQTKINDRLVKQNNGLILQIDSIKRTIPNQELLLLQYQREKYEFLILSLYDWNTVVRTTQRPDDIINRYQQEIKKINEKIGKIPQ